MRFDDMGNLRAAGPRRATEHGGIVRVRSTPLATNMSPYRLLFEGRGSPVPVKLLAWLAGSEKEANEAVRYPSEIRPHRIELS